jgi:hypothetical protein
MSEINHFNAFEQINKYADIISSNTMLMTKKKEMKGSHSSPIAHQVV